MDLLWWIYLISWNVNNGRSSYQKFRQKSLCHLDGHSINNNFLLATNLLNRHLFVYCFSFNSKYKLGFLFVITILYFSINSFETNATIFVNQLCISFYRISKRMLPIYYFNNKRKISRSVMSKFFIFFLLTHFYFAHITTTTTHITTTPNFINESWIFNLHLLIDVRMK